MLKFLIGLLGCSKAPSVTTTTDAMGSFTIETKTKKGSSFNMYRSLILYRNRKLMTRIGEGFNAILATGKYQEYFLPVVPE